MLTFSPTVKSRNCPFLIKVNIGSSILHTKGTTSKIGDIPDFAALRNGDQFIKWLPKLDMYLKNGVT